MKCLLIVLTVIAIGNTKSMEHRNGNHVNSNAIIRQLFEMLKYYIRNGYVEKDVPVLDPLLLEYTALDIITPDKLLSLYAGFQNAALNGIGHFNVLDTEFTREEISMNISLVFPLIDFKSEHYEIEGVVFEFIPIRGSGKFGIQIHNLQLSGKLFLEQSEDGKSILIKSISSPKFNIERIVSNSEYDGNIDEVLNALINDVMAEYLTRFNKYIAWTYSTKIVEKLNPFLNKFDSWRIIATLL